MRSCAAAVLDWDNSLRRGFTVLDWAFFLARHDTFDTEEETELLRLFRLYDAGDISYVDLSWRAPYVYGAGMAGQPVDRVAELSEQFVVEDNEVFDFAQPLIRLLNDMGMSTIVLSGAPVEILKIYEQKFGWASTWAIEVERADGHYGSRIVRNPATPDTKREIVESLRATYDIVVALGDSDSDIPVLEAASYKIIMDDSALIPEENVALHVCSDWPSARLVSEVRNFIMREGGP